MAGKMMEGLEKARVTKQRYISHLHQLKLESAVMEALASKARGVAPLPLKERLSNPSTDAELERFRKQWEAQRDRLLELPDVLGKLEEDAKERARLLKAQAAQFQRVREKRLELAKLTSRQTRLRDSRSSLAERRVMMEEELADLPQRVSQRFMPARKKLLVEVFIPEEEKRNGQLRLAQGFINELLALSQERVKALYLDRSLFRRFYWRQFVRGWQIAMDPKHPGLLGLHNLPASIKVLVRTFRHNLLLNGTGDAIQPKLRGFPSWGLAEIASRLETLAQQGPGAEPDYLVLPPTLPLRDALALMNRKDVLFNGVPRMVLMYVAKFDGAQLKTDEALREIYFKAVRHNVVLNVDGHEVVDNPKSIADRLLEETLGCAIDIKRIEPLSEDEAKLESRS
jgi:hypothetical protein